MKDQHIQDFYEFGAFRLDLKKRRLTCGGEIISLTPKEFEVLLLLIENRERVVEKDELLDAVWKDTFVEEGTLTRNVSWLRKKLAACESDEKIIETLPKRGYRFLPEVVSGGEERDLIIVEEKIVRQIQIEEIIEFEQSASEGENEFIETGAPDYKALPAAPVERNFSPPFWIAPVILILGLFAFAAVYRGYFNDRRPEITLATKVAPFAGLPGRENSPAFSPDGKQMVFSWNGGIENGRFDIYVKIIGAGESVRLTDTAAADEINPVFAPDGKSVAFVRVLEARNEIVLIPALGGAERLIYERASYASLSFSPDGKLLAHAELDASNDEAGIFTINLQTGERTRLTALENPAIDHTPRFSPDGKSLAYIRYFTSFKREIFIVPATGGEPRQITSDDRRIYGLAWNFDSRELFFTSFRAAGQLNLWRVGLNGDQPQMISTGSKNLNDLAISPNGRTIAFVEETADENIWEILPDSDSSNVSRPLIRSSRADHSQQFSPDGTNIVFASERTGNYEIWMADADGKDQRQLTDSETSAGSPRFSPNGKSVLYDAQIAGGSDIFIISINGGEPHRLTETGNNSLPAWSADGRWVFFLSNRSGDAQIWKMPVSGGEAMQITKQGAFEMFAAPDGEQIIYSKGAGKSGLWSVGANGENEKPLPELGEAGAWRSWSVTEKGIYYTAFATQIPLRIEFYDFKSKQTRQIARVDKTPLNYYANLTVSADGKRILYARQDQTNASIMLAELAE